MNETNNPIVEEKLKLIEEEHKRRIEEMKLEYESECDKKIADLNQNIKSLVYEVLSYCPGAKQEKIDELKEITLIRSLKNKAGNISIELQCNNEITDENILSNMLKFRENRNINDWDVYWGNVWKIRYWIDSYTIDEIDEYIWRILEDNWFHWKNFDSFDWLLSDLFKTWQEKWYSLFDLFFNNAINNNEKTLINILLDLYMDIQYKILPYYSNWIKWLVDEDEKFLYRKNRSKLVKISSKIQKILNNALIIESSENRKNIEILLKKYILFKHEESETQDFYRNLWRSIDVAYSDGISHLTNIRDAYKRAKWEEFHDEQRKRIDEIFPEELKWWSVLDTWFLYKNKWMRFYWLIENNESYKRIYEEWESIIFDNREKVQNYLQEDSALLDYWCYSWDKAKSLLQGIKKYVKYLPVDVNTDMIWKAKENIESLGIDVLDWIQSSWDITEPLNIPAEENNITYFFTWWSIWNYNDEQIHKILTWTFNPQKWKCLVMDYYKSPKNLDDVKTLLESYDNKETEDWFINWLLNLWFRPRFYESAMNKFYWTTDNVLRHYDRYDQFNNLKLFLEKFLKFTVRYEFYANWDKFCAEIWDNNKMKVFKYVWNSYVECDDSEVAKLHELSTIKEFEWFSWTIVEWFECIEDSELLRDIDWDLAKRVSSSESHWFYYDLSFDVVHPVKSKRQVGFRVKIWDEYKFFPAKFEKWNFYSIEISRRFSRKEIEELFDEAGREIKENIDDDRYKYLNLLIATSKK